MSSQTIHEISDILFDNREKLPDGDFLNLMNMLGSLSKSIQGNNRLKVGDVVKAWTKSSDILDRRILGRGVITRLNLKSARVRFDQEYEFFDWKTFEFVKYQELTVKNDRIYKE